MREPTAARPALPGALSGRRRRALLRLVAAVSALLAQPTPAEASPQWSAGALAAACLVGGGEAAFEDLAFCGDVRADVLFGRTRTSDWGIGPYLTLGTAAFEDLRVSAGARLLIPLVEDFPLVASAGALIDDAGNVGIDTSLFIGVRSYNFHGSYNLTAGLVVGTQYDLSDSDRSVLLLGAQVDALVFALPFLLAWGALH